MSAPSSVPDALSALPPGDRAPTFDEPWQAEAFALTLALHRKGLFTWKEWTETLGREIAEAQSRGDPDSGSTYYQHWLRAIERLVQERGLASRETLERCRNAWAHAAERTPHGEPIELSPADFG